MGVGWRERVKARSAVGWSAAMGVGWRERVKARSAVGWSAAMGEHAVGRLGSALVIASIGALAVCVAALPSSSSPR
jgi:hypothetical protein